MQIALLYLHFLPRSHFFFVFIAELINTTIDGLNAHSHSYLYSHFGAGEGRINWHIVMFIIWFIKNASHR